MTPVPPPASPCLRVRLIYGDVEQHDAGSRFYLSYSGSAPSGANCVALAGDVSAAWGTHLAGLAGTNYDLEEVDVLDIATDSGLSGQWTGSVGGTRSGTNLPIQVCTNVEFGIARRYRGGKPRQFFPFGVESDQANAAQWGGSYLTAVNTGVAAFFAEIEALDVGAIGTLQHVNLSYYKGFHNITNSSGRERAVPTYRDAALVDAVSGYFAKQTLGSQRRRRTATSG